VLLATVLTSRARRVEELAAARGRLVADTIGAEERERKRLAEALHDEAVQDLLAAGQDLDDAASGDGDALERAREGVRTALAQLRGVVSTLHPYVLEHAGLEAALHSLVERRRRGSTEWTLEVDGDARGPHDRLVVSVARELIANAATHAAAQAVNVSVRRENGALLLEVADDGRGIDPERARAAVAEATSGWRPARSASRPRAGGSSCSSARAAALSPGPGSARGHDGRGGKHHEHGAGPDGPAALARQGGDPREDRRDRYEEEVSDSDLTSMPGSSVPWSSADPHSSRRSGTGRRVRM
jgi:two-component system NarL family sensor kinase